MKPFGPIVITGFMGCGKTKIARELARRLNVAMVDVDETIREREGRTPAQIIVEDGEPAFRALESTALRNLLETKAAGVISLGGGAWISELNRKLIDQHRGLSVWLDTTFEICWARIEASGDDRPLGKTREQAQTLYDRRRPIYQLASVRIEVLTEEPLHNLASRIQRELARD